MFINNRNISRTFFTSVISQIKSTLNINHFIRHKNTLVQNNKKTPIVKNNRKLTPVKKNHGAIIPKTKVQAVIFKDAIMKEEITPTDELTKDDIMTKNGITTTDKMINDEVTQINNILKDYQNIKDNGSDEFAILYNLMR